MISSENTNKPKSRGVGSLVALDPLQRYMQEVASYPMLTQGEELELTKRYREHGDIEAAKQLVISHLRLVAKIAMQYRSANYNVHDLIQEGSIGLLQAVKHFEPNKGARLAHYATWWIRSYILKFIIDNFRMIKIGTTKEQKRLFYNLMREKKQLESMGYVATPVELSKRLGVDAKTVEDMHRRLTTPELPLEAPTRKQNENEGGRWQDTIPSTAATPDVALAEHQTEQLLKDKFAEFSETLSDREKKIFKERLLSEVPLTLKEIAEQFGISKERVRQIEERLIERLKGFFKESGIEVETLRR